MNLSRRSCLIFVAVRVAGLLAQLRLASIHPFQTFFVSETSLPAFLTAWQICQSPVVDSQIVAWTQLPRIRQDRITQPH